MILAIWTVLPGDSTKSAEKWATSIQKLDDTAENEPLQTSKIPKHGDCYATSVLSELGLVKKEKKPTECEVLQDAPRRASEQRDGSNWPCVVYLKFSDFGNL